MSVFEWQQELALTPYSLVGSCANLGILVFVELECNQRQRRMSPFGFEAKLAGIMFKVCA